MPFTRVQRRLKVASVVGWVAFAPLLVEASDPSSQWRLAATIFGVSMVGVSMLWVQSILLNDLAQWVMDWVRAYMLGRHDEAHANDDPDPGRRLRSVV